MTKFKTPLRVELVDDKGQGRWKLLEPVVFQSDIVGEVVVPAGFTTDFASVPRLPGAYLLTGNRAHRAATVHDYLLEHSDIRRDIIDRVFREAMLDCGIPIAIVTEMYAGVAAHTATMNVEHKDVGAI